MYRQVLLAGCRCVWNKRTVNYAKYSWKWWLHPVLVRTTYAPLPIPHNCCIFIALYHVECVVHRDASVRAVTFTSWRCSMPFYIHWLYFIFRCIR
jgi:hypothetical protein